MLHECVKFRRLPIRIYGGAPVTPSNSEVFSGHRTFIKTGTLISGHGFMSLHIKHKHT